MTPTELVLQQIKLPKRVKALHQYQIEDIDNLATKTSCGLYWDMGTGKTLSSIIIGCYQIIVGRFKKVMVLLPETLITQWASVLTEMGIEHVVYRGSPKQRADMKLNKDFLLMSYQIFQRDYDRLKSIKCYYIIDEATLMGNPSNLLFKMLNGGVVEKKEEVALGNTGIKKPKKVSIQYKSINKGCCLLCGIPVIKPPDWYGLIKTIAPEIYSSKSQFDRLHVTGYDRFNKPDGFDNLDLLMDNARFWTSSRLLSDTGVELPQLITKVVRYELHPEHLKLYRRLINEKYIQTKDEPINALQATALYHWCQRIVLCPERADYSKDPVGFELLDELLKSQKHFLIFSNYVDTNKKIMTRYNIGAIYGGTTSKQRDEYLTKFKSGELNGLTIHPKSGGYGLDLPQAKYVNFMELPVTPRDYLQSIARANRQGQTDRVVVTIPYAVGTIQESLYRKIQDTCDDMSLITRMPRSLSEDFNREVKTKEQLFKELRGEI